MPPKAAASAVAEGMKAADYWLAVEREPHAAVSQHLLIMRSVGVRREQSSYCMARTSDAVASLLVSIGGDILWSR